MLSLSAQTLTKTLPYKPIIINNEYFFATFPLVSKMDDKSNQNSEIPTLTDSQEKVLSLLFVFSGTLSVLGSSIIVFKILKNLKKATPYDRLMLGLSGFDIVASLTYILTPFILPQETSMRVWARGTDGTCTFLGFLSQLSFAAVFYNCMLSFYYLLTVRFGVSPLERATNARAMIQSCLLILLGGYCRYGTYHAV